VDSNCEATEWAKPLLLSCKGAVWAGQFLGVSSICHIVCCQTDMLKNPTQSAHQASLSVANSLSLEVLARIPSKTLRWVLHTKLHR
jgi:hypothetical protein